MINHYISILQIGTRFKRIFGEAYYRMVVMDLYPSLKSMIVRSAILLDPSIDNIYHATNIWFSSAGYVTLGRFTLLPDNVYLIESRMVWDKYHKYLNGNLEYTTIDMTFNLVFYRPQL